jgi:hypothetical protein
MVLQINNGMIQYLGLSIPREINTKIKCLLIVNMFITIVVLDKAKSVVFHYYRSFLKVYQRFLQLCC